MKLRSKYEREIVKHIQALTDQFTIKRTRNGHIKFIFEGVRRASVVFCGSPSDGRSTKNSIADARRAIMTAGVALKEAP